MLDAGEEYETPSRRGSIVPKIVKKSKRGSINQNLLDDQDEDYDYDFDGEHFQRGSIYSKRNEQPGLATSDDEYDGPATGIQGGNK